MGKLRFLAFTALAVSQVGHAEEQDSSAQQREERQQSPDRSSIVVTASQTSQEIRTAPATISVIAGSDLRRRPVQDLAEAVENEPGVLINSVGMSRRGISIRGMSEEHVLTLVDGRRINDASANMAHVDFNLGWVPGIAIDRVEVVRGPLSALYGSEALAGVINVITRRPDDRLEVSALALQGFRDGEGGDSSQVAALVGGPLNEQLRLACGIEIVRRENRDTHLFFGAKFLELPADLFQSLRAYILRRQVDLYYEHKRTELRRKGQLT